MHKILLMVNGLSRVGKDTYTKHLLEVCTVMGVRGAFASSIDPVRDMLRGVGCNVDSKGAAERKLLSVVGDALEDYNSFKTHHVVKQAMAHFVEPGNALFITHVREPHMMDKIRKTNIECNTGGDCATVLVKGDRGIKSGPADEEIENYSYNYCIGNFGTEGDLRKIASCMMQGLFY